MISLIGNNEVILPERKVTTIPVTPAPQFGIDNTGTPWGRLDGPLDHITLGGLPTFIGRIYNTKTRVWIFQHDYATGFWARPSYMGELPANFMADNSYVFANDFKPTKGIKWGINYFFTNIIPDVPVPGLPMGVAYAAARLEYYLTDRICFAQGSISCTTTPGSILRAPLVQGTKRFMTTASAGCPSSNNWGIAEIDAESLENSFTVSDGSGSSGDQPLLRDPNVNDIFGTHGQRTAYLGNNLIAVIPKGGYGNGTVLKIYRFAPQGKNPSPENTCGGELGMEAYLVYQKEITDIVGTGSYSNISGIWSNGRGLLALCYARQTPFKRRFIFFQFPGPVIQVVDFGSTGGAPGNPYYPYLFDNGYIGYMVDSSCRISTTAIDLNINIKYTPRAEANSVYAGNIVQNF